MQNARNSCGFYFQICRWMLVFIFFIFHTINSRYLSLVVVLSSCAWLYYKTAMLLACITISLFILLFNALFSNIYWSPLQAVWTLLCVVGSLYDLCYRAASLWINNIALTTTFLAPNKCCIVGHTQVRTWNRTRVSATLSICRNQEIKLVNFTPEYF